MFCPALLRYYAFFSFDCFLLKVAVGSINMGFFSVLTLHNHECCPLAVTVGNCNTELHSFLLYSDNISETCVNIDTYNSLLE